MAELTVEQLRDSFMQAHEAGDMKAARALADELHRRESGGPQQRGMLLPITRDNTGVRFDINSGLTGVVKRAVQYPGQVMRGEIDPLSDEGIQRNLEFSTIASPVNPGIRSGDKIIPGVSTAMKKDVKPPSAMALKEAADSGYDALRATGVDYSSASIKQLAETIKAELTQQGFIPENAKTTYRILDKLSSPPDNSVMGISGLETARSVFGKLAASSSDDVEKAASSIVKRKLSEFIEKPPSQAVVAGPANRAAQFATEARGNYAASRRSAAIQGVEDASALRAAAANSGQNTGNAIRQKLTTFLLNPKATQGFTPEELKAVEQIIRGTGSQNGMRWLGNVLGGGGGLGMGVTAGMGAAGGAAIGGPTGAAIGATVPPMMGAGAKMYYNRLINKALTALDETVRSRSPLYQEMLRQTPAMPVSTFPRTTATRGLLATGAAGMGSNRGRQSGGY